MENLHYQQRNEFEFEVGDPTLPGFLIRPEVGGIESGGKGKGVDPPVYEN